MNRRGNRGKRAPGATSQIAAAILAALAVLGTADARASATTARRVPAASGPLSPARHARRARAPSANLTRADLRAWHVGPAGRGIWRSVEAGTAAACLHDGAISPVRQVASPTFTPPSALIAQRVASEVVVFAGTSPARRVERALAGAAAAQCLQGALRRALEPNAAADGLRLNAAVETTSLARSPTGARHWFAYRAAMTAVPVDPRVHPFSLYDDLMGFRITRELVEVDIVSARQLFPASQERRLLTLLYRRARRLSR